MTGRNNCFYDFEPFRIDTLKRQLLRDGQIVPLKSKAFDTLLFLARRQGETITKDELMSAVWFDTAVEENNLAQQISALRKTLGEQAKTPQFIITIPGQGYSFIAPVKETFVEESEIALAETASLIPAEAVYKDEKAETYKKSDWLTEGMSFVRYFKSPQIVLTIILFASAALSVSFLYNYLNSKASICVLPFKSLDNNEKSNLYSYGIPSFVTAKIGNLPNMIVRPPSTPTADVSGTYFGQEQNVIAIGRDNNVDTVLTGSTQCEGDVVQVTVHLWDVKNNRQIWAKIFTRKASDAINAQDAISEEIISALQTKLTN